MYDALYVTRALPPFDRGGALLMTRSGAPAHLLLSAVDTQGRITGKPYPIASSGDGFAVYQIVSMDKKGFAGWIAGPPGEDANSVGSIDLATISLSGQ